MAENLLGRLADTVDSTRALNEADDRPRQIVVDDDMGVLEVLALAQHIGRDEYPQFVIFLDLVSMVVADRAETPR